MTSTGGLSSAWLMRFGLMFVMMGVGGVWFSYDGWVVYPLDNQRWEEYQKVKDIPNQWEAVAAEKGWSAEVPEIKHTDESMTTQRGIGIACSVIAVILLIWILLSMTKKVAVDEQGIRVGGAVIPYGAVKNIDKSRWDNKGIAVVRYQHEGKDGSVTIDDYKYKGGEAVLKTIEQHTGGTGEPAGEESGDV